MYTPRNRISRLYPQALGSLFVASYDSQGYSGGIRTSLHAGLTSTSCVRIALDPRYTASARIQQETQFPNNSYIFIEMCLHRRCIETTVLLLLRACSFPREPPCLAINVYSGFSVPDFRRHVTVYYSSCIHIKILSVITE
jgi:hypothetical protein